MKGLLIVIDGTDGSGKATQTQILVDKLRSLGYEVEIADFPRYNKPSAILVENYLNGKYGEANQVNAKAASIFYAIDRFDSAHENIHRWLSQGKIVISNRYVSANMGHQAGKIRDIEERDKFLEWLHDLEYNIFGLPHPDKHILLFMSPSIGQKLVELKGKRSYIEGDNLHDVHTKDLNHLKNASEAYLYVAKKYNWDIIQSNPDNILRSREDIANDIWLKIQPLLKKN